MITTPWEALTRRHVDDLIQYSVRESKFIDYQLELTEGNDQSRKEFLGDISSFANTLGGHVIYRVPSSGPVTDRSRWLWCDERRVCATRQPAHRNRMIRRRTVSVQSCGTM